MTLNDNTVGQFVFFQNNNDTTVYGGTITKVNGGQITIHEHRQAAQIKSRFTPLYLNSTNGRYEGKVKPQDEHSPVTHDVTPHNIIVAGSINAYHVEQHMFDTLRTLGVLDN